MNREKQVVRYTAYTLLGAVCVVSIGAVWYEPSFEFLKNAYTAHHFIGSIMFMALLSLSTVVAPLTSLPLVPMMAPIMGPMHTALLAVGGWSFGAVIAFLTARYGGSPILKRYMDTSTIEHLESTLPKETHFLLLVMLRMLLPVDLLSYALGLVSTVSFTQYLLTTVIGVTGFAFVFAYMGDAILSRNYVLFGWLSVVSILTLGVTLRYVRKNLRK